MKKIIAIYIPCTFFYKFFKCFFNAIQKSGYEILIVFHDIPLYLKLKIDNVPTIPLILKSNFDVKAFKEYCKDVNFDTLLNVIDKSHSHDHAIKLYYSVYTLLQKDIFKKIEYFFIPGGTRTIDKAMGYFCFKKKIKTLFFETSNLPNKIFVDYKGVNVNSSMFDNHRIFLNKYPEVTDSLFCEWIRDYEIYKKNKIPQAKFLDLNYKYLVGLLLSLLNIFFNFAYLKPNSCKRFLLSVKSYLKRKNNISFVNNVNLNNEKYIFVPLQVTTDSQILVNSDIDNMGLIDYSIQKAKNNFILYVKIHPAETDTSFINYIIRKHKKDFIVVTNNTTDLIKNSEKIISINSTISLEAKFYKKDIEILGKSFYKNFSWSDTKKYVMHHLFDMCLFKPKELSSDGLKILLEKYHKNL